MDFTCLSYLNIITSKGNLSLFSHLKHILVLIFSHIFLLDSPPSDHDHDHGHHDDHHEYDYRGVLPSPPSLVVVPVLFLAETVKRQLPVMSYNRFLEKRQPASDDHHDEVSMNDKDECVVCMNPIELDDEVRVPNNCCHVFHRECLDGWVDQGQPTCPLCRSKLVATSKNHDDDQGDPWRMERMIYIYGDDVYFLG